MGEGREGRRCKTAVILTIPSMPLSWPGGKGDGRKKHRGASPLQKIKIKSPRNFWAGIMFIGFGAFALIVAQLHYPMGTALDMGPAYFPSVLGGMLVVLGLLIAAKSLATEGLKVNPFYLRPLLFILGSCIVFSYLLNPLGVILSIVALVFMSAYGGREFKWKEVAILTLVMIGISVVVFVKGLKLSFPIWPAFME